MFGLSGLSLLVVLSQASPVMIQNPTNPTKRVTTTTNASKELLDVNVVLGGGGSSSGGGDGGYTIVIQGPGADGGAAWGVSIQDPRGQATMALSIPVVIASNQSAVPVSGTVAVTNIDVTLSSRLAEATFTGRFPAAGALSDNFANPTTTQIASMTMLWDGANWDRAPGNSTDGALVNLGANNDVTVTGSVTASGTVTANQGTPGSTANRWPVQLTDGTDLTLVSAGGSLQVTCDNCGGASPFEDNDAFTAGTTAVGISGYVYDDTPSALTDGNAGAARVSANRNQYTQIRDGAGNERGANVNASNAVLTAQTGELPAGTQNIGDVDVASIAAGDNNIGNVDIVTFPDNEPVAQGTAASSANRWKVQLTDGTDDNLVSAAGALLVDGSATTQPISGTVTVGVFPDNEPVAQGTAASSANRWKVQLTDGTDDNLVSAGGALLVDGSATTQPISGTVTVGTFPDNEPFNVAQWLGSTAPTVGSKTSANSIPVVLASDQGAHPVTLTSTTITGTVAATQSGTWTVQPGNTANSTPWLTTDTPRTVASANNSGTCVSVTASTTVLASNGSRRAYGFKASEANTAAVHCKLGATATTSNMPFGAGSAWSQDTGAVYTGVIDCIAASGTQSVCPYEFN